MDHDTNPITDWLRYCRRYYTPATCKQYAYSCWYVNEFFQKNLHFPTLPEIERYLDSLLERESARTVNNCLTAIKSFFRWYEGSESRVEGIKPLKTQPPIARCLSPKEYKTVLGVATDNDRFALQFLGNTGLRRSEFVALRPSNVDHELKYIAVVGKGQKRRLVPVNHVVRYILTVQPQFAFVRHYRNEAAVNVAFAKIAQLASVPRFGPHALRHFFATRLIRAGVPLIIVSRILGHSNTQITEQIYCHLAPSDVLGATDCLEL